MTRAFHHLREISDYATGLGKLCPEPYSYEIRVGDTVDIVKKVFGFSFGSGKVIDVIEHMEPFKGMIDAVNQGRIDLEDLLDDSITQTYPLWGQRYHQNCLYNSAQSCIVEINERVSVTARVLSWIRKNHPTTDISALSNQDICLFEFQLEGLEIRLERIDKKLFDAKVRVRSLVDDDSVESTADIEVYNQKFSDCDKVENVAWSDDIVPRTLLDALNEEVDTLCKKERKDYHPGSGKVVRDIIHPSLYCYVRGVSTVLEPPRSRDGKSQIKSRKESESPYRRDVDFWGRMYEESDYQWLPAEFVVDDKGSVSINSYINNLDRDKYPRAYELIANIFAAFVPMFESVCGCLRHDFYGDERPEEVVSIPLRNRKLQVVTKIVEYRVNKDENFDGVWHVEGMSHENILATGLCILKRDETFTGAAISFKRYLFEKEGENLIFNTPQNANRPTEIMEGGDVRPIGTMETPYGRALVFPNSHIHKLSNMGSSDGKDSVRRILVFWLVNPDAPIISTANVAEQQRTMSFKEAKKHQLALMKERKLHKESFNERQVFLCEH